MSGDRYVIVYRDGGISRLLDRKMADDILPVLMWHPSESKRPAYRIRIREKRLPLHMTFVAHLLDRLDPSEAYRSAGLRR